MGLLRESSTRDKQMVALYASLAFVFVFFYLLVFPRALPAELTLVPSKATVLTDLKAEKLTPHGSFFVLGDREGYWSPEGQLEQVGLKRPQAAVSGDKIAWYDASQSRIVVEDASGPLFQIVGEQFPFWVQGRLFTLDENRLGLAAWGAQGQLLWRKHFSSLVTAIDTTDKLTVVGTLDGRLQIFGANGASVGGFQPGGSRLPVIYNVSVAPDESSILVLAGLDPKRFLVLERGGNEFRPVFHKPLKETSPWPTPLGFLNKGALAYYQNERGLALLDPRSPGQEVILGTQGHPMLLEALEGGRLVAFAEHLEGKQELRIASVTGSSLVSLPFSAQSLLLKRQGSSLFLGVDQTLLRMEVLVQ